MGTNHEKKKSISISKIKKEFRSGLNRFEPTQTGFLRMVG